MSKQLKQIIKLSKKTGDRIVVFDNSEPNDSFVLMPLNQYEELLGLNEEKEEKIEQNVEKPVLTEKVRSDRIQDSEKIWRNNDNFNGDNVYSSGQVLKNKFKANNNWRIPNSIKEAAEEVEGENRD